MINYIIVGFIIPWLIGFYLFFKNPRLLVVFIPIGIVSACIINIWGFSYFWELEIAFEETSLSAMPFNLGLYPILGCLFVATLHYSKLNKFITFLLFTFVTTAFEYFALMQGHVIYRNGWNIYWTAVSYFVSYSIIYFYYRIVKRYSII